MIVEEMTSLSCNHFLYIQPIFKQIIFIKVICIISYKPIITVFLFSVYIILCSRILCDFSTTNSFFIYIYMMYFSFVCLKCIIISVVAYLVLPLKWIHFGLLEEISLHNGSFMFPVQVTVLLFILFASFNSCFYIKCLNFFNSIDFLKYSFVRSFSGLVISFRPILT